MEPINQSEPNAPKVAARRYRAKVLASLLAASRRKIQSRLRDTAWSLREGMTRVRDGIRDAQRRRSIRRALIALDDALLKDIGSERERIDAAVEGLLRHTRADGSSSNAAIVELRTGADTTSAPQRDFDRVA